jgi:hypothetical protein
MKQIITILIFSLFSFSSFSQIGGEDEVYLGGDLINPKFNGGELDKFYEFVNKNFDFSKVKQKGKIVAAFTINENGEVKGIKIVQFLDVESATEMIRVLKLSPKWVSAKRGGKPVSVELKLPLDFK